MDPQPSSRNPFQMYLAELSLKSTSRNDGFCFFPTANFYTSQQWFERIPVQYQVHVLIEHKYRYQSCIFGNRSSGGILLSPLSPPPSQNHAPTIVQHQFHYPLKEFKMKFVPSVLSLFLAFASTAPSAAAASSLRSDGDVPRNLMKKSRRGRRRSPRRVNISAAASVEQELIGPNPAVPLDIDTDTTASIEISFAGDFSEAEFELDIFDGEDILFAHLHCGEAGSNGPVIVTLIPPTEGGPTIAEVDGRAADGDLVIDSPGAVTCSGNPINNLAALYEAILDRSIYLNVHTAASPPGLVRGQIFP